MVRIKDTNPHYSAKAAPTRVDAIPTSPDTHIGNDAATGEAAFTVLPVKFDGDCAPHIRKLRKYADCCVGEAQEVSLPPKKVEKNMPLTDEMLSEFRYWMSFCEIAS